MTLPCEAHGIIFSEALANLQVLANGSCHSIEGIKLEELGLKTGEAKLLVQGNLLGAAQDASIILTDFPVAILQPMFRALPALEHAAPAVAASGEPSSCQRDPSLAAMHIGFELLTES